MQPKPHDPVDDGNGTCDTCNLPVGHRKVHPPAVKSPARPRDPGTLPIVRKADPITSQVAAQRMQPTRDSARGRVLTYLQDAQDNSDGGWVDAIELTLPHVGGFSGTRRMRELRDGGWPIETREKPHVPNVWQHRLRKDTP